MYLSLEPNSDEESRDKLAKWVTLIKPMFCECQDRLLNPSNANMSRFYLPEMSDSHS